MDATLHEQRAALPPLENLKRADPCTSPSEELCFGPREKTNRRMLLLQHQNCGQQGYMEEYTMQPALGDMFNTGQPQNKPQQTSACDQLHLQTSSCDQLNLQTSACDQLNLQTSACNQLNLQTSSCDQLNLQTSSCNQLNQQPCLQTSACDQLNLSQQANIALTDLLPAVFTDTMQPAASSPASYAFVGKDEVCSPRTCNQVSPSVSPQLPYSSPKISPHLSYSSPNLSPQLAYSSPSVSPQLPYSYPHVSPQLPYSTPSVSPQLPYSSPSVSPQLHYSSPSVSPQLPYSSPNLSPQLPYSYPHIDPQLPYSSSDLSSQLQTSQTHCSDPTQQRLPSFEEVYSSQCWQEYSDCRGVDGSDAYLYHHTPPSADSAPRQYVELGFHIKHEPSANVSDLYTGPRSTLGAVFGDNSRQDRAASGSCADVSRAAADAGSPKSDTKERSMRQLLCAVCGDVAACQHYGVRTCEGCKGFFKRTVQKNAKYVCTTGLQSCVVDKRRRNRCQFCRFQKCLDHGMVREVVRTAALKGRRGRLPSKTRPPACSSLVVTLLQAHLNASASVRDQEPAVSCHDVQQLYCQLMASFQATRRFADRIPGFSHLCSHDRQALLQNSFLELFVLQLAHRYNPQDEKFVFETGLVIDRQQCQKMLGTWIDSITEFAASLIAIHVDQSSFACLAALTIITDRHGTRQPQCVEALQSSISSALGQHVEFGRGSASSVYFLPQLLDKLSQLRSLSAHGLQTLFYLKLHDPTPAPEPIEALLQQSMSF